MYICEVYIPVRAYIFVILCYFSLSLHTHLKYLQNKNKIGVGMLETQS